MNELTDRELLEAYGAGSEEAFGILVGRYVGMVYGAARRMGPGYLAEDVTQAVFILLARRGGGMRRPEYLAAWLLRAAHFCAADARRSDQRRKKHEGKAAAMMETVVTEEAGDGECSELAGKLDGALAALSAGDRTAILLRYFREESVGEMARSLGVSEDAAKKRVSRAVGRLRKIFLRRKVEMGMGALAGVLGNEALAVPAGLAGQTAMVALGKAAGSGLAVLIAKGAVRMMRYGMAKYVAGVLSLMVAAGVVAMVLVAGRVPAQGAEAGGPVVGVVSSLAKVEYAADPAVKVRVTEREGGAGMKGVKVELVNVHRFNDGESVSGVTAKDGSVNLSYPRGMGDEVGISVTKAGYASTGMMWARRGE